MKDIFTEEELEADPILKYFNYKHLPNNLQPVSRAFYVQALQIVRLTERNAERSAGLRKLLEAKDCIVRASLK